MSDRWYYQLLMEEFGPVSDGAVRQLLKDGTLSSSDLVRADGTDEWIPVSSMPPGEDSGDPAVISDLSELAFDFEDSGTSTKRPTSDAAAPATAPLAPAPQYYTQSLGQILGPMSEADLIGMAESGALDHSDLVRFGEGGEWKVADEWPELAMALAQGASISDAPVSTAPPSTRRLFQTAGRPAESSEKTTGTLDENQNSETGARDATNPNHAEAEKAPTAQDPTAQDPLSSENSGAESSTDGAAADADAVRKPGRRKARKSKSSREEDKLLNEIFDDVFADDEKTSRSPMPGAATVSGTAAASGSGGRDSAPAVASKSPADKSSASAGPTASLTSGPKSSEVASAASTISSSPPPPGPTTAISPSMSAAPEPPRSSPAPVPYSPPKAKRSVQFDGPVRNVAIGIGVAILAVAIWKFGIPGLGGVNPGRYSSRMTEVMAQYKAMGDNPSQPQWQELSSATRVEFMTYYKAMLEAGASGGDNAALMEAMKSVIALASLSFEDKEQRAALMEKAEKSVSGL